MYITERSLDGRMLSQHHYRHLFSSAWKKHEESRSSETPRHLSLDGLSRQARSPVCRILLEGVDCEETKHLHLILHAMLSMDLPQSTSRLLGNIPTRSSDKIQINPSSAYAKENCRSTPASGIRIAQTTTFH